MPREYYVYPNGTPIVVAGNNEYATQIPMSASDATDVCTSVNNKVAKSGDTMTGALIMEGKDIVLGTTGSSSDDSGDIVWKYGDGTEKMRIWSDDSPTTASGPKYRVYKSDGTSLYSGYLALGNSDGMAITSNTVNGIYTLNGGQQPPNYFGKNTVGFLMSNVTLSSDNHYKNIMYMDCYSGNDVGGVTALALDREEAKGWIMQSGASRATWDHAAELVTSGNIGSQNVQSATRTIPYVGNGSDNIAALKAIFPSVPKSVGAVVKTVHGSHSMAFGWFLDGASYATVGTAYGGWFISDYGTPSWVGINAGTWTAANFITNKNASSYFVVQQVNHTVSGGATAGWHQNLSVSCAKTGYTPIAVFGGPFSGASSGAGLWWMGERLDGTTIRYSYNSTRTDTGNLTFSFQVLYVKQ